MSRLSLEPLASSRMASRVPLLVKGKGRKPSRLPVAPRAKPSNAPRAKRTEPTHRVKSSQDAKETANTTKNAETNQQTPTIRVAVPKPTATVAKPTVTVAKPTVTVAKPTVTVAKPTVTVAKPTVTVAKPTVTVAKPTVTVAKPTVTVAKPVAEPRRAGGISIGGSLSKGVSTTPIAAVKPTVRSPVVLPMQRRPERLAKITSAGPVYRASPLMRPRAGSIGTSPAANPMKQRLIRKLDIKPHQSPRRAMQLKQQDVLRQQEGPASPLILGGKNATDVDVAMPDVRLDTQQTQETAAKNTEDAVEPKKKRQISKRRKISETAEVETTSEETPPRRRSLRRKAKRKSSYCEEAGSSGSEPDDDHDEDVDPNDLDLPEEGKNIYVPARERATMWAKSVLEKQDDETKDGGEMSKALVVREKKLNRALTRKRSDSAASSIASLIGPAGQSSRSRMKELKNKEPSEMTMGELALTVPKGRRLKRHEREEAASSADTPLPGSSGEGSSSLLNMNALNRVRSLSVSSESAAFAGSLVTPQVQIVDGQMVVLENTIKLGDELRNTADVVSRGSMGGDDTPGLPPRPSGSRYKSLNQYTPGKRWGKEETKQFYYCLSQVGPNFSMMATLFPTRKRKELKSKFKYEEKHHSNLIEIALRASAAPLDTEMVNVISQMVDKEAQRKLNAQKKRRKAKSPLEAALNGDDPDADETASVISSSVAPSPMSSSTMTPVTHMEEFVEATNDEDLFLPNRRDSFDFSG